jgi:hypothetical protein
MVSFNNNGNAILISRQNRNSYLIIKTKICATVTMLKENISVKLKRLFQVFVLLSLLFSPIGSNQSARASTNAPGFQNSIQDQTTLSMVIEPSSLTIGQSARVIVGLNNVPAEGYTSAELTCTYDPNLVEASSIVIGNLFGIDPVTAINGPHTGLFVVAIAGSHGNKATSSGTVIAFAVRALQAGQTDLNCSARASKGDNVLVQIPSIAARLTVLGNVPTSTTTPAIRITIDPGQTTASRIGVINPNETIRYVLNATAGQVLSINLTAPANEVAIGVNGPTGLVLKPLDASPTWSTVITTSGDHTITLTNLTGSSSKSYTLEVSLTPPGATATPTIPPTACDKAEFIADINVPPGTGMVPGAHFTKTWRLKNAGSCRWTLSYRIAFFSGEQMGAPSSIQLPLNVEPGQTVDISLNLIAPSVPGTYRGYWIFQNATGSLFGIGPLANEPWFVDLVVSDTPVTAGPTFTPSSTSNSPTPTSTETPGAPTASQSPTPTLTAGGPTATQTFGVAYDFVAGMCSATWFSGAGQLPCPGIEGNPNGFVFKVDNPRLETGATDNRPSLLTFPQNVQDGYIQGFYPPIHIQNGDRFRSTLSCEFGAIDCRVAFRLDYQVGADPIKTFWIFLERYEGQSYAADIDLSPLAGKDVKFILTVLANGPFSGDRALWIAPILYRPNGAVTPVVPSATFTPSESLTPTPLPDSGMLTGQVHAGKPVTLSLYRDNAILVTSGTANSDGTFSFTIPVGTYLLFARADGYLGAEGFVTITAGNASTMPVISLPAGDIDGNNRIDPFDVLTIGMNYNHALPSVADLNNDGIINVLDLELLANNYRKAGLVPWNDFG